MSTIYEFKFQTNRANPPRNGKFSFKQRQCARDEPQTLKPLISKMKFASLNSMFGSLANAFGSESNFFNNVIHMKSIVP